MLLKIIGTKGETGGAVEDLFADDGSFGDLDAAFKDVEGVAVATDSYDDTGEDQAAEATRVTAGSGDTP